MKWAVKSFQMEYFWIVTFSFDLREHICTDQFIIVEKFEISF